LFVSLKHFSFLFENNENWSDFNDLFGSVSFYDEVLKELLTNKKNILAKKYDSKLKIGSQLNGIMENKNDCKLNEKNDLKIKKLNPLF
jgi:hypothetical protein